MTIREQLVQQVLALPEPAWARGRGFHQHRHRTFFVGTFFVGPPMWYAYHPGPYYYGPAFEASNAPPSVYIEKFAMCTGECDKGLGIFFLAFTLAGWLVGYAPRLIALLQALWPEQIALLGYLGWQMLGPHVGFVGLFLLAVAGRVFCLTRWIAGLDGRSTTPSTATQNNLSPTA